MFNFTTDFLLYGTVAVSRSVILEFQLTNDNSLTRQRQVLLWFSYTYQIDTLLTLTLTVLDSPVSYYDHLGYAYAATDDKTATTSTSASYYLRPLLKTTSSSNVVS
jgi:hypothetical protein